MKKSTLEKVKELHKIFGEGKIKTLDKHEVNPGLPLNSRENYLYFTLPVCINFQRSSPAMWASALKTYEDSKTRYLFYPEKVVKTPREKLQADLLKHKLGLQKNKHTEIWTAISKGLDTHFENDPRKLLQSGDLDIAKILKIIQLEKKDSFPYLRGPKLSNYWLYILSKFTDAKFKNMHELSIIPDTHVIQSTVKLGMLGVEEATPEKVSETWKLLLKDSDITPVQMHPVLWNWSRNGFNPKV